VPIRIEIKGLGQAKANFQQLSGQVQRDIGRQALRDAARKLAEPMKAATYTTFTRRTGAIRAGLGVGVQHDPRSDKLTGYVEQYAQSIAGPATPFASLVRQRLGTKRRRLAPTSSIAFWWRFLEFGTGPRRAGGTPAFLRGHKVGSHPKGQARQLKSVGAWLATGNRGGVTARPWLRPVFGANAPQAIQSFRDTMLRLIDAAVSAMPK
jgi:HK97 gp10 family phage protein